MNRDEIIKRIKKNKNSRRDAIILIADFLVISKKDAEKIYIEEFEK